MHTSVPHPKSREPIASSFPQPTSPVNPSILPLHKKAKQAPAPNDHRHTDRQSFQAHQAQHAQQPEIVPAHHSLDNRMPNSGDQCSLGSAQALGQALGTTTDPGPECPIAFGPALEQYVQQLETALREEPAILDEVLQVLHEYQAQQIHSTALQRQVRTTTNAEGMPLMCVTFAASMSSVHIILASISCCRHGVQHWLYLSVLCMVHSSTLELSL